VDRVMRCDRDTIDLLSGECRKERWSSAVTTRRAFLRQLGCLRGDPWLCDPGSLRVCRFGERAVCASIREWAIGVPRYAIIKWQNDLTRSGRPGRPATARHNAVGNGTRAGNPAGTDDRPPSVY
jgi:hypothetical protein